MSLMKIGILVALYVVALTGKSFAVEATKNTSMVIATPFLSATSSTDLSTNGLRICKEDVEQVKHDAYAFVAGEEMTIALADQVEKVRSENLELQTNTDREVVLLMLEE